MTRPDSEKSTVRSMTPFRALPFLLLTTLLGCGLDLSGTPVFNDALPSGTQVAIGTFTGTGATGTVRVIRTATGQYTVRLEGLNVTASLPAYLTGTVGGATGGFQTQLRGASGNQNYNFSTGGSNQSWGSVELRPPGGVTVTTPFAVAAFPANGG